MSGLTVTGSTSSSAALSCLNVLVSTVWHLNLTVPYIFTTQEMVMMVQASHTNAARRHAGATGWPQLAPKKEACGRRDGRLEATTRIAWSTLDDNWCRFASVRYSIPNTYYLDQNLNDHRYNSSTKEAAAVRLR